MNKSIKTIVSYLLTLSMLFALSFNAYASNEPTYIEKDNLLDGKIMLIDEDGNILPMPREDLSTARYIYPGTGFLVERDETPGDYVQILNLAQKGTFWMRTSGDLGVIQGDSVRANFSKHYSGTLTATVVKNGSVYYEIHNSEPSLILQINSWIKYKVG